MIGWEGHYTLQHSHSVSAESLTFWACRSISCMHSHSHESMVPYMLLHWPILSRQNDRCCFDLASRSPFFFAPSTSIVISLLDLHCSDYRNGWGLIVFSQKFSWHLSHNSERWMVSLQYPWYQQCSVGRRGEGEGEGLGFQVSSLLIHETCQSPIVTLFSLKCPSAAPAISSSYDACLGNSGDI